MARDLDMFSLLPEAILLVIVSFLPFKEAARTCILSKMWLEVWKSTKNIEFNELDFVKDDESDETKEAQRRAFISFITHWMKQYTADVVDKFSLKVSNPENCRHTIESCVAFATQHAVKELGLDFSRPDREDDDDDDDDDDLKDREALFELPNHVYGLKMIESLKLYSCSFVMSNLLNFRALKDVSLGRVEVITSTLKTLLFTCVLIENLSLKKCWNLDDFDIGVEKLRLRRLVIVNCIFVHDYFRFNAPCLKFFKYYGGVGIFNIEVCPYVIEEIDVDFGLLSLFSGCGNLLYKLLEDFYPVRVLTVCSVLLQTVPFCHKRGRVQRGLNVRHLIMKTQIHPFELCGFMFLLHSCPKLAKLTLDIALRKILPGYTPPHTVDFGKFWEDTLVPLCFRRTLKVVELKGFRGTREEVRASTYLIRYGRILQKININVLKEENGDSEKVQSRIAVARSLLDIPNASENLEISIE